MTLMNVVALRGDICKIRFSMTARWSGLADFTDLL